MGGVEATRQILRAQPGCRVIVLTTFEDDQEVFDALHAGAAGYLLKGTSGAQIIEAALAVMRGESCLQPSVAAKVVAEFNRLSRPAPAPPPSKQLEILSQREQDVLRQLAGGKSNKEIAAALGVAEGTVKNHMSSIIAKLEVLDRTQAALKARALGLV
jgi:DNA-binding NarL/FixJ family response regulator